MKRIRQFYKEQKNFWAGVVLIAVLVGVVMVSYQRKKTTLPSAELVLSATYNKADGLNVGAPVRLAGTMVGRVSDIQLDSFYRVKATLSFPQKIDLPLDTAAMIETDGLVGSKYIELLPGGEEELLTTGDVFMYTQDVLLLDELLERFLGWMRLKKGIVENELIIKGEE